jgi:hypothetical protein
MLSRLGDVSALITMGDQDDRWLSALIMLMIGRLGN